MDNEPPNRAETKMGPPKLEIIGYELEVRPCDGLWARFEGRIVSLVSTGSATHRHHCLPDHGPASNGRIFVTTRPYWLRSRDRDRLERKLKAMLDARTREQRRLKAERIPLTDTMAGWQ